MKCFCVYDLNPGDLPIPYRYLYLIHMFLGYYFKDYKHIQYIYHILTLAKWDDSVS